MSGEFLRTALGEVLASIGLTDTTGQPLGFSPHDFGPLFITDAIRSGPPPHIAQVIARHTNTNININTPATAPASAPTDRFSRARLPGPSSAETSARTREGPPRGPGTGHEPIAAAHSWAARDRARRE
jgi:hypothetical protein